MNSIFNKIFSGVILIVLAVNTPVQAESGPISPFLNGAFPDTTPGSSPGADWATQNAFTNLTFVEPVRIVEHPTQAKFYVVSKDGQINAIDDNPTTNTKTLFLDLRGQVRTPTVGEGGLTGFVLHPEFDDQASPNRGYVYVWYRAPGGDPEDGYQRLSRFTVPDGDDSVDAGSEFIMIQQYDRSSNHGGGSMFFGTDGFLYISVGDEGNNFDRALSTQRLDLGLFSGILRIDVDQDASRSHPILRQPLNPAAPPAGSPDSFTQGYYIPDDNPFNNSTGANLEEFYSIGLRHPWVISHDLDTGNIWVGDVGQNIIEEVNIAFKGSNHQWAYKEGSVDGLIPTPATIIGTETTPIWEYDHNVGFAIIGAGVYRGALYPELYGKYLFSDFVGGQLWTLQQTGGAPDVTQIADIPGGFSIGINAYLMTRDGRILMAQSAGGLDAGGTISELLPQSGAVVTAQPPALLSDTFAFQDLSTLTVETGCIPYDMNTPFWSDAAIKTRWMCLPNDGSYNTPDEQIVFSENDEWGFPVGAVLIKHFEMELSDVTPGTRRRLETRFIVHAADGYYGITYKWRADGSDADLLLTSFEEDLTIETATGSRTETWHYPSRNECIRCHTTNAGSVLGPNTRQLNGDYHYPGTPAPANQLSTLNGLGLFTPSIVEADIPTFLTSTPTDDTSASLAARARSYLDTNCQYCHRPGGVRANFDARLKTPLAEQGLINEPLHEVSGIEGEAIVVPGSLTLSALYKRTNATDDQFGMPPLAKDFVDAPGVAVLADWINSLVGFTVGNSITDAPFLDSHNPSLYINESDAYTNLDGEVVTLTIDTFEFYARNVGNPVTPIVVKVNGDNDFTVLAIGSTRTGSEYFQGSNSFPFDDFAERKITLQPGETIATGFMDSFADGSGWGAGTVIPAINDSAEDEVWALLPSPLILASNGFVAGRDTPAVVENESPLVTNAGKEVSEFTTLNRSYSFAINFNYGYSTSTGGGGGDPSSVTLGNNAAADGVNLDDWLSNLMVNESDTYTNTTSEIQQVNIDQFNFYARQLADPVTPFVVLVNGDNNFTVLAIGTTRTAYSVGANSVAFSDGGSVVVNLNPGEKLATGFLDANADGSGGGDGAVIPYDDGGDQIWYSGGPAGTDSGSVSVGQAPVEGLFNTLTTLNRSYHYQFVLTVNGNQVPTADAGGPYAGDVGSTISFDGSGSNDPDNDSLAYSWNFGDGNVGSGVLPTHVYASAGSYTVSLIVNDGTVDSSVSMATVVVNANVTLGNDAVTDGVNLDTWLSNMVVNESDTFTNTGSEIQQVNINQFNFYARQVADPVTPFIVLVNGDNNFTVVAVGTTRTTYSVGANSFAFSDGGPVVIDLNPNERLATGFLDANADGSGSGTGAVISWDDGGDEIWYTGGKLGSDSGSVTVGQAPVEGVFKTVTTLNRDYHFQIELSAIDNNQAPAAVVGGPYSGNVGAAISFDGSGSNDADGDSLTYSWNFGDGFVANGVAPMHVYAAGGTYTVSLTVNDGKTDSLVSMTTATVNANVTLGNDAATDGDNADSWLSNLVVNESDTYTNTSSTVQQVNINQFDFYARQVADPVTPFVVLVNANNNFTVVAVGTTRTDYSVGANSVVFDDGGSVVVSLNPGETLATGFLDANADGSGGGAGSVISWDDGSGEIWYTGGKLGSDSGSVTVGQAPVEGVFKTVTTLTRNYHYQIAMSIGTSTPGNQVPVAIVGGPYNGVAGVAVSFDGSGSSDGDGDSLAYSWDFGDGATGTGATPTHIYATDDSYTVTLTVNDGTVDSGVSSTTATITSVSNQAPVAVVGGPYSGVAGAAAVSFDGTGSSDGDGDSLIYNWLFGDGATGTGATPTHVYVTAGTYTVSLIVNDGSVDSIASTTTASISGTGTAVSLGNDATIDGANADGWLSNLVVNESDVYTNSSTEVQQVSIDVFAFYARQVADPVTPFVVQVNSDNNFTVLAVGTTRAAYSVGANSVAFSDSGSVVISLNPGETLATGFLDANADGSGSGTGPVIPYDDGGDQIWYTGGKLGSDSGSVIVGQAPVEGLFKTLTTLNRNYHYQIAVSVSGSAPSNQVPVAIVGGPYSGAAGVAVSFDGTGSSDGDGDSLAYSWDFGDGATGTGATPTHVYATDDAYTVTLTVNDGTVDSGVSSTTATITTVSNQVPVAVVGGSYSGVAGAAVSFDGTGSSDGDGDSLTYSWAFGDGGVGTGDAPTHVYATNGTYTVSLIVNDGTEDSLVSSTTAIIGDNTSGTAVTLGNSATADGANADGWLSNLVVNESDTYTNSSTEVQQVSIDMFAFYARQVADPVTPFVVQVNGDNNFTVLAIGTSRSTYSTGANSVAFSDSGSVVVSLNPGEILATGFLDANADGSGGGTGPVIPYDDGGDQIWYTGGKLGSDSGSVSIGQAPVEGVFKTLTTLSRNYHYQFELSVTGGENLTPVLLNGSFEEDVLSGSSLVTTVLSDWTVTSGNVELLGNSVYAAPDGSQTLDLNGTQAGSIQQFAIGMVPDSLYTLYVTYADQADRGNAPNLVTAEINVNGAQVGTIKTTSNASFFITCNGYEFTSTSSGTALIDIISTTSGQYGAVIDNVYIAAGGLPQPPESTGIVNGSFETPIAGDPHLCGDELSGWLVTQENIDVVSSNGWEAYEGGFSLDLGGHGPGGVAQTVTGLAPGQTYDLTFAYARHLQWGTAPLTADVFINGSLVSQLTATTDNYSPDWLTKTISVVAPANGKVTMEFRSTSLDVGGGVIIDDVKLLVAPLM